MNDSAGDSTAAEQNMERLKLTGKGTIEHQDIASAFYEFDVTGNPTAGGDQPMQSREALVKDVLKAIINNEMNNSFDTNAENMAGTDIDMEELMFENEDDASVAQILGDDGRRRGFGNGTPKKDDDDDPFKNITLDSVGGLESQIQWLQQSILKPLKGNGANPWGLPPPKGVLFYGPPGTGKTLLARAFGNELSKNIGKPVKFFHRKGPDCFSKWLGESSKNLRAIFAEAIANKPSILFFDELDGLCPNRDGPNVNQAVTSVVTTMLGLMDTLPKGEVFIFGATNRVEAVDPAMRRPGRFDKHLEFIPPNFEARKKIVTINTQKWKTSHPDEQLLNELGQKTVGFTGADIEKLCRETFFTAFHRHVPDADLNASIANLQILPGDWNIALTKIKPSNSAVFGSTLYVPQLPNKRINKLVENIQTDILNQVTPFLPRHSESAMNIDQTTNSSTEVSSFILYNNATMVADAVILESMILPGVFADKKFNDMPIYILSQENILMTNDQASQLSKISSTIDQAAKSFEPCVLFIPGVDRIATEMRNLELYITRQLMQLRGKPVLVLATSSCNPSQIPKESNIGKVFEGNQRSFFVRNPNRAERETFFKTIFCGAANHVNGEEIVASPGDRVKQLKKLWNDAVNLSENNSIEFILGLYDTLLQIATKHFGNVDKNQMLLQFKQILKEYQLNKLQLVD